MARRLVEAGADGLVLFNRFFQPDIDLESLSVRPHLELTTSSDLRLPLRWTAILRGRISASIGATGGCHTSDDLLKLLLAGADAVLIASALIKHGPEHARVLLEALGSWLEEREYESLEQMKGSVSQINCERPAAFERSNYMSALTSFTRAFNH
jgi:dihydroorotate dehydrogenase (fumarate)